MITKPSLLWLLSVNDDFESVLELAVAELAISCSSVIYQNYAVYMEIGAQHYKNTITPSP